MVNEKGIAAFLYYGFLPTVDQRVLSEPWFRPLSDVVRGELIEGDCAKTIDRGVRILRGLFKDTPGATHVIPLSGGLDSRAILGGLLDAGLKDRIVAVTFGTPGTYDYEIGRLVARNAGVRHELIDISRIPPTEETLLDTCSTGAAWTWLFDGFYQRLAAKRFGEDATYWSGYMGEALTGKDLLSRESGDWSEARIQFAAANRLVRSTCLTPQGFDPTKALPKTVLCEDCILGYDEQLNFALLQDRWFGRAVVPTGYDYRTPFVDEAWSAFMLSAPRDVRVGQRLYKDTLTAAFPTLYALPTKTQYGLTMSAPAWRLQLRRARLGAGLLRRRILPLVKWPPSPLINYIDIDESLREGGMLIGLGRRSLRDLKRRGAVDWLDVDNLWRRHQRRKANHGDALTLLIALEINLKAAESSVVPGAVGGTGVVRY